jgi:hypothetical protein
MYDAGWPQTAVGTSIDALFSDIYRVLEDVQKTKDRLESITNSIVHCSRELRNLERIHTNRWRFYGPDVSDDPFELRDVLVGFTICCNSLTYVNSPFSSADADDDFVADGCLFPSNPKRGWKKKQIKALEADFTEQERSLSLALSNAV